jgi:hypothetical protein
MRPVAWRLRSRPVEPRRLSTGRSMEECPNDEELLTLEASPRRCLLDAGQEKSAKARAATRRALVESVMTPAAVGLHIPGHDRMSPSARLEEGHLLLYVLTSTAY